MIKAEAVAVSDALGAAGFSHEIIVTVPPNRDVLTAYLVQVTPVLVFEAMKISELQRMAERFGCGLAFRNGSFVFVEGSA